MASETLVDSEIEGGLNLLRVLDAAGFDVRAALWAYYSTEERWRFIIATEHGERDKREPYLAAAEAIARERKLNPDENILSLDRVRITGLKDPVVTGFRSYLKKDVSRTERLSNTLVNGIYIENAIIHRLAA